MKSYSENKNVINYPYIDYIVKTYVQELASDEAKINKVNMGLFRDAMLHVSSKKRDTDKTYERLEYLGDAVFHIVVTEYLYKRYDEENEGFLTRLRIRIERGDSMAELSKILGLNTYVQIRGININDHILEDIFESFLGAFYINFGMEYSKKFVVSLIEKHKNLAELISNDDNYKDILLRYFHQMKWGHPVYGEAAPQRAQAHAGSKTGNSSANGRFTSVVANPFGKKIGVGSANSKKQAEQLASKKALITLGIIKGGEIDKNWLDKIEKIEKIQKVEKEKGDKKPISVFNPNNKLIKREDIKALLISYNVVVNNLSSIKIKLFHEAMTHRSYLNKRKLSPEDIIESKVAGAIKLQPKSNERLQFLGDAIIHFIIGEMLYNKYGSMEEGFLTRLRCKLENRDTLYKLAKDTNISSFILISQNIEILHGRNNVNIIGGGFESFIGAAYLNLGIRTCKSFISEVIRIELNIEKIAENETNYKDLVLQLYNKNHWGHPRYEVLLEEGPDHKKIFTMGILLGGKIMGTGKAPSKKKAEQIASKKMFDNFAKK